MIEDDPIITKTKIAEALNLSHVSVTHIVVNRLNMKRIGSIWTKMEDFEIEKLKRDEESKTKNLRKDFSANNGNKKEASFGLDIKIEKEEKSEQLNSEFCAETKIQEGDSFQLEMKTEEKNRREEFSKLGVEFNNDGSTNVDDNSSFVDGVEDFLVNGDFLYIKKELCDDEIVTKDIQYDTDQLNSNTIKEETLHIFDVIKSEVSEYNQIAMNEIKQDDYNSVSHENNVKRVGKRKYTNGKQKSNQPKAPYPCQYCGKTFSQKSHAYRHMKISCKIILKSTLQGERITKYHCKKCNKYFITKYTLDRHMDNFHSKIDERFRCSVCPKRYYNEKELQIHLKHSSCDGIIEKRFAKFVCNKCNRSYRENNSLQRHIKYECGMEPHLFCHHCDFATKQKINLSRHIQRKHMDLSGYTKCPNCPKSYKNDSSLARHLNYECGKNPRFICDYCGHRSKRKFCLQVHIQKKHMRK